MSGMRSFRLQARTDATQAVVKKNLPGGFTVKVEPVTWTVHKGSNYRYYPESKPNIKTDKWNSWIEAMHINVKDGDGKTVVQVAVKSFFSGKPVVYHLRQPTPKIETLAKDIARAIKADGRFFRMPLLGQGIFSGYDHSHVGGL